MSNRGVLFIISGASATGKDTIVSEILKNYSDRAVLSVSMTTRQPRGNERNGVDYFFVSADEFENNIKNDRMLEYAKYGSNYYGTPLEPVEKWLDEGKIVFLVIEVQGASIVRSKFPDARSVFVLPPSMTVLEKRLRGRGTEDEDTIYQRLEIAKSEILRAEEYDYIVVNDVLDDAVNDIVAVCKYEKCLTNKTDINSSFVSRATQLKKDNMINTVREVMRNA